LQEENDRQRSAKKEGFETLHQEFSSLKERLAVQLRHYHTLLANRDSDTAGPREEGVIPAFFVLLKTVPATRLPVTKRLLA
jgi:hypothetical protein